MIVYFSGPSGFTQKFVEKVGLPAQRIPTKVKEVEGFEVSGPFILLCPTYERKIVRGPNKGSMTYIPKQVAKFLSIEDNRDNMLGVVGLGNRNFFEDFSRAADDISAKTGVPVLGRIELDGTDDDVQKFREGLVRFWHSR